MKTPYKKEFLFVYGTLKRGCRAFHFLKDEQFFSEGYTVRKYGFVSFGDFPAVVKNLRPCFHVKGEIFLIDGNKLSEIDEYENCPYFYLRESEKVVLLGTNTTIECFIYVLNTKNVKEGFSIMHSCEEFIEWKCS